MPKVCVNIYYSNNYNDWFASNLFNFCMSLTMGVLIRVFKMVLLSSYLKCTFRVYTEQSKERFVKSSSIGLFPGPNMASFSWSSM